MPRPENVKLDANSGPESAKDSQLTREDQKFVNMPLADRQAWWICTRWKKFQKEMANAEYSLLKKNTKYPLHRNIRRLEEVAQLLEYLEPMLRTLRKIPTVNLEWPKEHQDRVKEVEQRDHVQNLRCYYGGVKITDFLSPGLKTVAELLKRMSTRRGPGAPRKWWIERCVRDLRIISRKEMGREDLDWVAKQMAENFPEEFPPDDGSGKDQVKRIKKLIARHEKPRPVKKPRQEIEVPDMKSENFFPKGRVTNLEYMPVELAVAMLETFSSFIPTRLVQKEKTSSAKTSVRRWTAPKE